MMALPPAGQMLELFKHAACSRRNEWAPKRTVHPIASVDSSFQKARTWVHAPFTPQVETKGRTGPGAIYKVPGAMDAQVSSMKLTSPSPRFSTLERTLVRWEEEKCADAGILASCGVSQGHVMEQNVPHAGLSVEQPAAGCCKHVWGGRPHTQNNLPGPVQSSPPKQWAPPPGQYETRSSIGMQVRHAAHWPPLRMLQRQAFIVECLLFQL